MIFALLSQFSSPCISLWINKILHCYWTRTCLTNSSTLRTIVSLMAGANGLGNRVQVMALQICVTNPKIFPYRLLCSCPAANRVRNQF